MKQCETHRLLLRLIIVAGNVFEVFDAMVVVFHISVLALRLRMVQIRSMHISFPDSAHPAKLGQVLLIC